METIAFSMTRGGPFFRILRKLRLVRLDGHDLARQARAFIAVGWLPPQLFSLLGGTWSAAPAELVWHTLSLHSRYLVAIPLLLFGEQLLEARCRRAIDSVATDELGDGAARKVAACARSAERLRDLGLVELALAAAVFLVAFLVWKTTGHAALVRDYSQVDPTRAAALWQGLISLPLFNFSMLRWFWRWSIWAWLMWRLSRVGFAVSPSHPDGAGGLARLAEPTFAIATMLAGLSAVLAASWGSDIVYAHATLAAHLVHVAVVVVVAEVLAFVPLLTFIDLLATARQEGGDQYGRFGLAYTRAFHQRWIVLGEREGLLGTPDISGLADLISSVEHVNRMRVTPFNRLHLSAVLIGVLVPMVPLPLLASGVPLSDLLERTLKSLILG